MRIVVGEYGLTIIVRVTHHKLETLSSIVREPECVVREPESIVSEPECIVREPECIVREPESNYKGVGARLLGVESESMTGVMGWSQSLWCKSQRL